MKIMPVNGNHMAQIEGDAANYPHLLLEKYFLEAFSDEHQGSVAFRKIKEKRIMVPTDVQRWVSGMNSIISTWNAMPSYREADIRNAFAADLA